jgi:hypothetical protein
MRRVMQCGKTERTSSSTCQKDIVVSAYSKPRVGENLKVVFWTCK